MKTQKFYTIEESVYNAFDSLTTDKNINKSSFIEDCIKNFLKDNDMDFVDKLYSLKENPSHTVTVLSQDLSFYFLSDGSKMQKILFMQCFKECAPINPDEFFSKTNAVLENIAEKIKHIDESKVPDFPNVTASLDSIFDIYENRYGVERAKEIRRADVELLNEINNNYKAGEYSNKDALQLCEVLLCVMQLNFKPGEKEYELQQLLINILNKERSSAKPMERFPFKQSC